MKRKALSIFMVTALAVSMLAGCGSSSSGSAQTASSESGSAQASASESEAASGEKTTVNFYYSTDLENTVALQIQSFNESQDEIEVVPHSIPEDNYDDKVKVMAAGGSEVADVFWLRSPAQVKQYMDNGVLTDLKPYADASGVDLSPIETQLASVTDENGSFYAYPDYSTCWMLFYNKDLFDAKGLEYPGQMTWDEYLDLIASLTGEENGTKYWGGLSPIWTPNLGAIPAGEYLDSETLERTKEYAQIQHRMYVEDQSAPGIAEMTAGTFDINAYFAAGNVYTMINGDWTFRNVTDTDFEYGAAPLPVLDGVEPGTSAGQASYLVVPTTAQNPEAAYKFVEYYCTSVEGTSNLAKAHQIPCYQTEEAMEIFTNEVTNPGVEYRFDANVVDEQRNTVIYPSIIEAYSQELQLYLLDEQTLDETFDNFVELRDEIIASE